MLVTDDRLLAGRDPVDVARRAVRGGVTCVQLRLKQAGARELLGLARALRAALEVPVPGSLPRCIRLLVHAYTPRTREEVRHVYLRGATVLRPDRAKS